MPGFNAPTGQVVYYEFFSVSDPNISGSPVFSERINGETLIVIELTGDASDSDHPAHIHMNYAATTGPIDLDLTNVNGDAGMSKTNASSLNDDTAVIYDELINFNGYINVHNSATDLGPLVVQGNIGSNG